MKKIFDRSIADHDAGAAAKGEIEPVVADASVLKASAEDLSEWREAGLGVASLGELAVVLLAGTRHCLGSSAPKGMYDIGSRPVVRCFDSRRSDWRSSWRCPAKRRTRVLPCACRGTS